MLTLNKKKYISNQEVGLGVGGVDFSGCFIILYESVRSDPLFFKSENFISIFWKVADCIYAR